MHKKLKEIFKIEVVPVGTKGDIDVEFYLPEHDINNVDIKDLDNYIKHHYYPEYKILKYGIKQVDHNHIFKIIIRLDKQEVYTKNKKKLREYIQDLFDSQE